MAGRYAAPLATLAVAAVWMSVLGVAAQADAASWVLLARTDPALGEIDVVRAAAETLETRGEQLVPQEKVTAFFAGSTFTSPEPTAEDLAALTAAVGAAHALLIELDRSPADLGVHYRVRRYDADGGAITERQGDASAQADATALRDTVRAAVAEVVPPRASEPEAGAEPPIAAAPAEGQGAPGATPIPPPPGPQPPIAASPAAPVPGQPGAPGEAPPATAPPGGIVTTPLAPSVPSGHTYVQERVAPITRPPVVTAAVPGEPDTILYGRGWTLFFGVSPGSTSEATGLSGGTGIVNTAAGFNMGLGVFGGGSWLHYDIAPDHTLRLEASGRATVGAQLDLVDDQTYGGYGITFDLDVLGGEYLYYLTNDPLPAFVGAWGNLSGARFSAGQPSAASGAEPTDTLRLILPFRLSVGGGIGRLYPIHWRIVIARLERVLVADGALAGPIPDPVAQRIIAQWYAERDSLELPYDPENPYGFGFQRQVLSALQILKDTGLLRRPIHMLNAYRVGRIISDNQSVDRWHGWEVRGGLRLGPNVDKTWMGGTEQAPTAALPDFSLTVEVMARTVFNLTLESELRADPSLGIALLDDGAIANDLEGARRVVLDAAPTMEGATPFLPNGRFVFDLPITYARYIYDEGYDLTGYWNVHLATAIGVTNPTPSAPTGSCGGDCFAMSIAAGATYTFFTDNATGYTLGLNGGIGFAGEEARYGLNLVATMTLGSEGTSYTAPDQVGDEVPFGADWLPYPEDLGF